MTEKLYYSQPYATEFEAQIVRLDETGQVIALDRSLLYPGGGGQPCDLGWVSLDGEEFAVQEAYSADGLILASARPGRCRPNFRVRVSRAGWIGRAGTPICAIILPYTS